MRAGYFSVTMGSRSSARIVRSTSDLFSSGNTYSRSSKSGATLTIYSIAYSTKSAIIK